MTGPFRISIIDYLNAYPLNQAFKEGRLSEGIEFTYDFPSQCADNLASNKADAGLISSIEYQRISGLKVARGVCIASRDRVRSVVITTKKEFRDIRVLALDRFSRSSVALVNVLFMKLVGRCPKFVTMTPNLDLMLQKADAALLIGDAALQQEGHGLLTLDLATMWFQMTGLPFVFAFWALRQEAAIASLADRFRKAKDYGLDHLGQGHWDELSEKYHMDPEDLEHYLTCNIHYDLQAEEEHSLERFFRYCFEIDLIPEIRPLEWI